MYPESHLRANTKEDDDILIAFADRVTDQLEGRAVALAGQALTQELRETGFAMACDFLLSDGVVGSAEDRFLTKLADDLGVSPPIVQAVVQSAMIRHRRAS